MCACCVIAGCSPLAERQLSWLEEGRVWPCWVSITHRGTLMWGRWRGASMYEEVRGWGWGVGGRRGQAGVSGQVSRFYALSKSIEPEGVGLNHTHSYLCLPFILEHTHTHRNTKSRSWAWPPFSCRGERDTGKSYEPDLPVWR